MLGSVAFWRSVSLVLGIGCLLLLAILTQRTGDGGDEGRSDLPEIALERVSYRDLPGWKGDPLADFLPVFARSCAPVHGLEPSTPVNRFPRALGEVLPHGRLAGDWQRVCRQAEKLIDAETTGSQLRAFIEAAFVPYRVTQPGDDTVGGMVADGLFTGYFEPAYPARAEADDVFSVPVLTRPTDLQILDLGEFDKELAGRTIAGRVEGPAFAPYPGHREIIEEGVPAEPLVWMRPTDLLFLQIQGSGKLVLPDKVLRVGYAAQNGRDYTAIGRELVNMGAVPLEEMSMQAIRNWLDEADPAEAARVRYVNESYVFFRELTALPEPSLGPLGAQGVQLTPMRSLAVDRRYYPMGLPVWIDIDNPQTEGRLQRLMVAQDTGGAIKGPVRGDVYVGSGPDAGAIAGRMKQAGQMFVLLPRGEADVETAP